MDVQAELRREAAVVARITAVVQHEPIVCFGELIWGPEDLGPAWVDRALANRDPGVRFWSASRVVVFEFHRGELRYWAGGFPPVADSSTGWERFYAEGEERGVFPGVPEALAFTERFLVQALPIQLITTPRIAHYRRETGSGSEPLYGL